jgi:glycosyltransferase involved in cell wall biosynthesis
VRLLWISDSPESPSGFGAVTSAVCSRLSARGHQVEIIGWQTRSMTRWNGIPVRPVRHDVFGADVLQSHLMRFQPDFVITLADVWWMSFLADPPVQEYLDRSGARWVLYYPIDGADRDGTLPRGWRRMLEAADVPVAMSRFGVEVSAACGIDAAYLPHGCDLDLFLPPADRRAAKARFGYEDAFVVLSDARNQPRKLLPRTVDVAAGFARDRQDVVVHLHCDPDDDAARSDLYRYDARQDVAAMGLRGRVRFTANFRMLTTGGLSMADLATLYQAADAHLLCSWGEGFGLPSLQAAAAGVVPIAVAETASRELVCGHGFAIPAESTVVDEFGLERHLLSREAAVAALDRLYCDPAERDARGQAARAFALGYDWDRIVDGWEELLTAAPPRRKPARERVVQWVAGDANDASELPAPLAAAATDAFAPLPDGTQIEVRVSERQMGEVAAEIMRETFREGDELSLPVRLGPVFDGAPRARVGNVMVGAPDLPMAATLARIFPGLEVSLPAAGGNPTVAEPLALDELLPALVHYALVVDTAAWGPPDLDLACAALGVPFLGSSPLWTRPGPGGAAHQARRLLTDQGLSERRRALAVRRAVAARGQPTIDVLRARALCGQPDASAAIEVNAA